MRIASTIPASVLAISLIGSINARAQETGNELLVDCETFLQNQRGISPDDSLSFGGGPPTIQCYSFIHAIQQLSVIIIDPGHSLTYQCLPPDGSLTQLVRVLVEYGHRHPEKLHEKAAVFTLESFSEAFACSQ